MKNRIYFSALLLILLAALPLLGGCIPISKMISRTRGSSPRTTGRGSEGQELADEGADIFTDYLDGNGFRFEWNEVPPGGGIHFDGFVLGCPNGTVSTGVSVYGDLGGDVRLTEGGVTWDELMLVPLVKGENVVPHITEVVMEGTIEDPECHCEITQMITIEYEIDFIAGNALLKDATGMGEAVACECPGLGAVTALGEFYFPRDIQMPLEIIPPDHCD